MSEDQKAREAAQPEPQQAPAVKKPEVDKDQQTQQLYFSDWASI